VTVRVLWVVKGLGPGGAERLLVAAARAHDPRRVHVDCAYVLPHKDHLVGALEAAGVRCTCLSSRARDPSWPVALRRVLAAGDFDVVHVHSPVPGSVARAWVRAMPPERRPAVISTEHNTWQRHRAATRWANRVTSRWDAATFAVSGETAASMSGPAAARAHVLLHGIDVAGVAEQREHREAVRAELGIGPDELVVGTVANVTLQKAYPTLLQAARRVADRGRHVRVVAVGQGPLEQQMRDLVSTLGLEHTVLLTGFRDDAVRVMAAFDVFTLASDWEGLPVALMEALALGLPVVATRVGGVAEALTDGVDAVLVPPGDAGALADGWLRVLDDEGLRRDLSAASRRRAGDFDAARSVRVLDETYLALARPARHPAAAAAGPPPSAPPDGGLRIRAATDADRPAVLDLLRRSLGADDPRYAEFFAWKHDQNPFGPSPMWVAEHDGRVVAFRTFLRWEFVRGGQVLRAVRAVDTATDPDYRGRGLFRALTLHGVEQMREEGVAFVFNTPNDKSRPGYLTMGWRDVGRLPVAVRLRHPTVALRALSARTPADRWSQPLHVGTDAAAWLEERAHPGVPAPAHIRVVQTHLTPEFLRWRYGTPLLGYRVVEHGAAAVVVRARRRGEATELAVVAGWGDGDAMDRAAVRALADSGADYAIRLGSSGGRGRFVPAPGAGPRLTWRAVADPGMPPLPNWSLTLGDIELF
jgi:glycosyltransferase involved in cell wall biosynthesis/GNAT superfamily N-acetyltransferase